jgi:hypothetical protein
MEKRYTVKIYDRAGTTFKGNYDPIGGYAFNKTINGGVGALSINLPREFDNYGLSEDVELLDEIQIWVQDKDSTGEKIYSGYVSSIRSYINGAEQGVTLDVLGYVSRLAFTLDWDGTNISIARNSMTAGEIAKDVIDDYRTTVAEERINYSTLSSNTIAEYDASNEDGAYSLYTGADLKLGESFAVTTSRVLSTAKFRLSKQGSPTGTICAKIYAHSGTYGTSSVPTGSALATSANVDVATLTAGSAWVDFAFTGADAITLSASTNYCIALEFTSTSSNASNYVKVGLDATSPGYGGNPFKGTWSVLPEKKLDVSAQDSLPKGVALSGDGTKVYINGGYNRKIFQYTLGTAYDLSTGSYASKSYDISTQSSNPWGLFFKSDGTKVYVVDVSSVSPYPGRVFQYALGTAWDISTASYDSKTFDFSTQDTNVRSIFIKGDGTKMYAVGMSEQRIYQYTLGVAWDISSASYDNKSFFVGSQDTSLYGIFFKDDGTKVYITGYTNKRIYQYALGTAWDISTASYDNKSLHIGGQGSYVFGNPFKSDGTKVYAGNRENDVLNQYSLFSAWDVSTGSYETNDLIFNVTSLETSIDYTGTDISYTSNAKSSLETIDRVREMAGSNWYWYVDADNIFYFRQYPTTPTHLFVFGKDISNVEITRSADDIKNEFIFWNQLQPDDTNYLSTRYYNTDSINSYWHRFENLTDGRILDDASADELAGAFIGAYKDPNVSMKFEVKDNNMGDGYDIESIEPGHTCKILNIKDSSVVSSNMVITSVYYTPEKAIVYVSDLREITGRSLTNLRRQLDSTVYGDRPADLTSEAVT